MHKQRLCAQMEGRVITQRSTKAQQQQQRTNHSQIKSTKRRICNGQFNHPLLNPKPFPIPRPCNIRTLLTHPSTQFPLVSITITISIMYTIGAIIGRMIIVVVAGAVVAIVVNALVFRIFCREKLGKLQV